MPMDADDVVVRVDRDVVREIHRGGPIRGVCDLE
jgi:hypothetical protein